MSDYDRWLQKITAAITQTGNKRAVARWLSARMDTELKSTEVKLHRMIAGTQIPQANFSAALDAWLAAGSPLTLATDGRTQVSAKVKQKRARAGGLAKAATSKERLR